MPADRLSDHDIGCMHRQADLTPFPLLLQAALDELRESRLSLITAEELARAHGERADAATKALADKLAEVRKLGEEAKHSARRNGIPVSTIHNYYAGKLREIEGGAWAT
jgi:hypothetical protein